MYSVVQKLLNGITTSSAGLRMAIVNQFAIRLEIFASVILIPLAYLLGHTAVTRALMIASWMLVLIIELLNSAIETTIDRIGPEFHKLSGQAKDIASAAVLIAIVNAIMVWGVIIFL